MQMLRTFRRFKSCIKERFHGAVVPRNKVKTTVSAAKLVHGWDSINKIKCLFLIGLLSTLNRCKMLPNYDKESWAGHKELWERLLASVAGENIGEEPLSFHPDIS